MLVSPFSERYEVLPSILLFDLFLLYGKIKTICKGPVTLTTRISRGNIPEAFQENTKIFWAFSKKQTASQNTAQFFPFQKLPRRRGDRGDKNRKDDQSLHKNFHPGEEPKQHLPGTSKEINFRFLLSKSPYFL